MPYELPPLPYDYAALQPTIDEQTMRLHHGKHHQAYVDNLNKAGPNLIIALNHVSFLDAGLALSLRDRKPVFAIDVGIAKRWWVRPFVKLTNAMPLDPMKPMAVRSLIEAVKAGNALIIFPEGRITVTGALRPAGSVP